MNVRRLFAWMVPPFRTDAAGWFARLKAGRITPQLDAKYRDWLAANPGNEVAYERQELAWELAGELADDEEINALITDAQRASRVTNAVRYRSRRLWMLSAVAAAFLLATLGATLYLLSGHQGQIYATAVGEQRTVVLPDQSRMVLNTSTRARVNFTRGERVIELEHGEATFSVTRDASRPFEVRAAQGITRVLGTEFNVLAAREGVTVSVLSGKVEVIASGRAETESPRSILVNGQEVTYQRDHLSTTRTANADRIQAWHAGRVAFDDAPLAQALGEFNRYTPNPVVLGDASLAQVRVTGLFRIGETEALLQALDAAFNIRAQRNGTTIELHRREVVSESR